MKSQWFSDLINVSIFSVRTGKNELNMQFFISFAFVRFFIAKEKQNNLTADRFPLHSIHYMVRQSRLSRSLVDATKQKKQNWKKRKFFARLTFAKWNFSSSRRSFLNEINCFVCTSNLAIDSRKLMSCSRSQQRKEAKKNAMISHSMSA